MPLDVLIPPHRTRGGYQQHSSERPLPFWKAHGSGQRYVGSLVLKRDLRVALCRMDSPDARNAALAMPTAKRFQAMKPPTAPSTGVSLHERLPVDYFAR